MPAIVNPAADKRAKTTLNGGFCDEASSSCVTSQCVFSSDERRVD